MTAELGSYRRNVVRFLLNLLMRSSFAAVVVYCCWVSIENYHYWFTWHVILSTVGIVPIMVEALILFAGDELWSIQLSRTEKYWIHGIAITIGTVLVSAGCIVYFVQPGLHLETTHGVTGLIAMVLMIVSVILGLFANYSQKLHSVARPIVIKFLHNLVGLLGYIIGIVSLCYAFYTNWFIFYTTEESRIVALIATILAALWSINAALVSAYNQMSTIFGPNYD